MLLSNRLVARELGLRVLAGEPTDQDQALVELCHRGLDLIEVFLHAATPLEKRIPAALQIASLCGDRATQTR